MIKRPRTRRRKTEELSEQKGIKVSTMNGEKKKIQKLDSFNRIIEKKEKKMKIE